MTCIRCRRVEAEAGKTNCRDCTTYKADHMQAQRDIRRLKGLCYVCGKVPVTKFSRCQDCRKRRVERYMKAKKAKSELEAPIWAVISSGHVKAAEITHVEALALLAKLEGLNDSGLCVVTADVAERLKASLAKRDETPEVAR